MSIVDRLRSDGEGERQCEREARIVLGGLLSEAADEIEQWRECALYDATMKGPVFKGWDRSALDRCRRRRST
jgi:hypothetical protein